MAGAGKVRKLLQGCGLGDYEETFLSNGFDDIQTVPLADNADLAIRHILARRLMYLGP